VIKNIIKYGIRIIKLPPFQITIGIILVILGAIGGPIPGFIGSFLGIPGLIILAKYFPSIKKLLNFLAKKSSLFRKILNKMQKTENEKND
tara:strand:+ start:395 stop:664 length:270 start_codon:yes stop_codon:yes gene_type:complete